MLRVAEQWHDSDLGRQRQGNEDNYYVQSPLFVVADGMGGAQAGEVASEIAVRAFRSGLPNGSPAEGLVRVIQGANHEIHEMSRAERQRAGMGTTLTAAYVTADDEVVVAHVGDSRAYRLRGGELLRLTRDHSLVGELVARGKLTEEQAEQHPQRSVITRALGPEPNVQVDVDVFPARAGDLFLLCSDGLTSMVPEPRIAPILSDERSLERAGKALIAAANDAGGRDNITVILFRLEAVDADAAPTEEQPTHSGETAPHSADVAAALRAAELQDTPRSTTAVKERPQDVEALPGDERPAPRPPAGRRRRRRALKLGVIALLIALPLLFAAWSASRLVYFIGTDVDDGRTITIFRGVPVELPGGIRLYEHLYSSGVTLQQVPPHRREQYTNHDWRSREDAEDLVRKLELGQLNQ